MEALFGEVMRTSEAPEWQRRSSPYAEICGCHYATAFLGTSWARDFNFSCFLAFSNEKMHVKRAETRRKRLKCNKIKILSTAPKREEGKSLFSFWFDMKGVRTAPYEWVEKEMRDMSYT